MGDFFNMGLNKGLKEFNKKQREENKKRERKAKRINDLKRIVISVSDYVFQLIAAILPGVIAFYLNNDIYANKLDNLFIGQFIVLIICFILYLIKEQPRINYTIISIIKYSLAPIGFFFTSLLSSSIVVFITKDYNSLVKLLATYFVVYFLSSLFFIATVSTAIVVAGLDEKWKGQFKLIRRRVQVSLVGCIVFITILVVGYWLVFNGLKAFV